MTWATIEPKIFYFEVQQSVHKAIEHFSFDIENLRMVEIGTCVEYLNLFIVNYKYSICLQLNLLHTHHYPY